MLYADSASQLCQHSSCVCTPCCPTVLLLLGVCMCQHRALQCTVLNMHTPHTGSCVQLVCHCVLVSSSGRCDASLNVLEDVRAHFRCCSDCDQPVDQLLCLPVGNALYNAVDTQSLHSCNTVAVQLLHCCVGCLVVCHCVSMHLLWCHLAGLAKHLPMGMSLGHVHVIYQARKLRHMACAVFAAASADQFLSL